MGKQRTRTWAAASVVVVVFLLVQGEARIARVSNGAGKKCGVSSVDVLSVNNRTFSVEYNLALHQPAACHQDKEWVGMLEPCDQPGSCRSARSSCHILRMKAGVGTSLLQDGGTWRLAVLGEEAESECFSALGQLVIPAVEVIFTTRSLTVNMRPDVRVKNITLYVYESRSSDQHPSCDNKAKFREVKRQAGKEGETAFKIERAFGSNQCYCFWMALEGWQGHQLLYSTSWFTNGNKCTPEDLWRPGPSVIGFKI